MYYKSRANYFCFNNFEAIIFISLQAVTKLSVYILKTENYWASRSGLTPRSMGKHRETGSSYK